jgi:nucleoid-associated protein YgaU
MGFWNRVKDVLVNGPTEAAENVREDKREEEAAKVEVPKVDAPEASAPEAPEAPSEPAAPAEPEYRTYTVKSGDTLSEIALGFGVDWHEMAELNNLENPDLIFPGQVFKVPNN